MADTRKILKIAELETLIEENPGRVIISVEGDKEYGIVVVPAPADRKGPRKSGIHQDYRYIGKKKGELDSFIKNSTESEPTED